MKHGWGPWTGRVETDRDGIETEYLRRSCQMRHTGGGSVTAADAVPCDAWQQIRVEDVEWKEGRYGPEVNVRRCLQKKRPDGSPAMEYGP